MGFQDKDIETKCKELLIAWEKHANPPEVEEVVDEAPPEDVDISEDAGGGSCGVEAQKTYIDLLRQDRRMAYERYTKYELDDTTGMPVRPTTTLYCGSWQVWFGEVVLSENAPEVLQPLSFDTCIIHIDPMYALGEQPNPGDFDTMRKLIEYFASDRCVVQ